MLSLQRKTNYSMEEIIYLYSNRSFYSEDEAAQESFTVGELIEFLETHYPDKSAKVVMENDNGYTYGYVNNTSFQPW